MSESDRAVRLQKLLARAGVASRRASENLMSQGRVSVNGHVVREMGARADPDTDVIHVDGMRLELRCTITHLVLNKPAGVLSTMFDDRGRACVGDYVAERPERLFHIGRLDADTEGLLLLSNDGELAHRLMHPSHEVAKTYLAELAGPVSRGLEHRVRTGVELDDGRVAADGFRVVQHLGERVLAEIVLHEGRKHVVRRLFAAVGCPVRRLVRTAVGPVRLGDQRPGTVRSLSREELGALYRAVGL